MVRPGTQFNSVLGLGTLAYRAVAHTLVVCPGAIMYAPNVDPGG